MGSSALAAIWGVVNALPGTQAIVKVTATDGRTGSGSLTL
jgi:hypothetical protein